jgi:hypothetical protein
MTIRHVYRFAPVLLCIGLCLGLCISASAQQGFVQKTVEDFADSEFVFPRSGSNAPFLPIAYASVRSYGEAKIEDTLTGETLEYSQQGASAAAGVPFLMNDSNALVLGGYLSSNHFDTNSAEIEDLRVDTVGLPLGWFKQVNPQWQIAGFVMPLGHRSTQRDSDWALQTMGGLFARYTQNERIWWAFGVFADDNTNESYVIPYAGASWVINPRWTLSAVMPWPSIIYAPNRDWMFSLGAAPSGAVWSRQRDNNEVAISLDAWDLGLTARRRLHRTLWLSARAGVGGLRGLRLNTGNGNVEEPEFGVGASGFFSLGIDIRPAMLP